MADITLTGSIEVECSKCGCTLAAEVDDWPRLTLKVEPCEACLETADDAGYERGTDDGRAEAEGA